MSPQYLVVDLGGVLFRFDHAHRLQCLADVFALPADRIDELLWRSGFGADCDSGKRVPRDRMSWGFHRSAARRYPGSPQLPAWPRRGPAACSSRA
ncbi:hypothetical protein E6R60_19435 [Streptomyces sp. A0642]|uniref:hypothetical protein n=1 Tax=Streptomyces sp. A0642 TaxID=2563100 RepID=UPI0010A253A9|nr:hypothetical protein [Streptomyces sp. A0642]THA74746.1 hypothetical protein E6R60_19435 [Streptomyces sp. A0642]